MCGIAGGVNIDFLDSTKIVETLLHRGPDEQNILKVDNTTLIHTRLSIIDINLGSQPLSRDGFTIVFNGEIYNYKELRSYISEYEIYTKSDTEVLLLLYIKYREKMLELLDGAFAFCIYNTHNRELFLCRDRAGKRPLYYYKNRDIFFFASELNSFSVLDREIDRESIEFFLRSGFFYRDSTVFRDIYGLLNSSYMIVDANLNIKKSSYFDIKSIYKDKKIIDKDYAISLFESAFDKSIKDRVESSDLEVGAFLSGGIDSSLVVAFASKYKKNLKTFTVKLDGGYDETPLARLVAKRYNTIHKELEIDVDLQNIEKILLSYGEPFFDSSAIPSYFVSQRAKEELTVILNGDGADELFGGYRRYLSLNLIKYAKYFSILKNILPKPKDKRSNYSHIFRLLNLAQKDGLEFYLSLSTDIFEGFYEFTKSRDIRRCEELISKCDYKSIDGAMMLDFELILFGDLLKKMDIATMSNSLEGRSPFLSKYMLELAPKIDSSLKIRGVSTKYLLRELSSKYLPKELLNAPKRGFEVPLKKWIEVDLKDNIFSRLTKDSKVVEFVDYEFIERLKERRVDVESEKRAKMLWNLFACEIWLDSF